ncbi:hypothetical protein VNO77_44272 [Canavalia gladiata]|uniref:Uncharacterized protein n=1 Tax=Canavalia gladiata TaxID=3824 RepID=A0AAN9JVQ9_CANGL
MVTKPIDSLWDRLWGPMPTPLCTLIYCSQGATEHIMVVVRTNDLRNGHFKFRRGETNDEHGYDDLRRLSHGPDLFMPRLLSKGL